MTTDELRGRGTQICVRLTQDVAKIAPEGIGSWDPAWAIVADADAEFLAALTAWEAEPTDDTKARVKITYHAVLDAWRDAALQYEAQQQGAG